MRPERPENVIHAPTTDRLFVALQEDAVFRIDFADDDWKCSKNARSLIVLFLFLRDGIMREHRCDGGRACAAFIPAERTSCFEILQMNPRSAWIFVTFPAVRYHGWPPLP
jgi:hypothetical protein